MDNENAAAIHLPGETGDYLTLSVHDRECPNSEDFWDGNWLSCTVEVKTGGFRGNVNLSLRNEDFVRFLPSLERLYEQLTGEATFDTLEGWLELRLIGDGHGHIQAKGRLTDSIGWIGGNNSLEFHFALDQTYLPPVIAQLQQALQQFPIVGQSPEKV